jgi:ADP-ribose pyrophosphatase
VKAEIVAREEVFRGFYRFERLRIRHDTFAGGARATVAREVLSRGDIVAVLPYDPARERFLLIEQFRPGALLAGVEPPWLVEIVAGYIEAAESPEDAARRETREEVGCAVVSLFPLASYFLAPNLSPDRVHLYLAHVDASEGAPFCGRTDEEEDIRVVPTGRAEARRLVGSGAIASPWALLGLSLFEARSGEGGGRGRAWMAP